MPSQFVIDITEASFQHEVMEFSMKTPVLVDFWADWCGPCKVLSPVLDEIADEYRGAIRIAKIDTEAEQRLASAFRIQSIPSVIAIYQGQMVNQFQGALPKAEVRRFVDAILATSGATPTEPEEAPEDPNMAAAHWQRKLATNPNDPEALLELSRLLLTNGQALEAKPLLLKIENGTTEHSAAKALLATMELLDEVSDAGGAQAVETRYLDDQNDFLARYLMGCLHAGSGNFVESLTLFVGLISDAPQEIKGKAKGAASIVFEAAGREDEAVEQLRRRLTALLF